jgi:hypothetical protein
MRKIRTPEEKVAKGIANLVGDVTLNLDEVGQHLANNLPNVFYRRLLEVVESATYEKEMKLERASRPEYALFD